MTEKIKIACVVGTRPEAIKMAPLVLALKREPVFETRVLASGQHTDMLFQALNHFGIEADANLNVMEHAQTLEHITSAVLEGVGSFLDENPQDLLLVHGDTTTTFASALAGFYRKTPVGHVEAGLRSHDLARPFPEEANRLLTDRIAELYFAPTLLSAENLWTEGVDKSRVFVTGNTVIDALFWTLGRSGETDLLGKVPEGKPLVLMTAHRRESWGEPLKEICAAARNILGKHPELRLLVPLHKNPAARNTIIDALRGCSNAIFTEPLDYPEFVAAMNRSLYIMSDSGGVQEEASALKKPVLILRELSERPEAIETGTGVLAGTDRHRIEREALRLLEDHAYRAAFADRSAPFGDGNASTRIVEIVKKYFAERLGERLQWASPSELECLSGRVPGA
ncbi:MAG: UDP-N-acetylglucosamine 2-epimerase (non-hydrolyzing) [Synergistaceae bacterium]|jgi:UDP-N-acetylglucosamine 2-epimerase (non-hydrolysing)|nr:UDP-N-acetylglucosamine 2-epimerase (non-hydrolyzing) [Synergistaceae bacterium]